MIMMEFSASNPTTTNVSEELELEDLLLELHALKKLYGLLHKCSEEVPNGDTHGFLDEKSRVVLKKLLDGATHRALQSQAKIVCCMPEPLPAEKTESRVLSQIVSYIPETPPMENAENGEPKIPIEEEASILEKFQKCLYVSSQRGNAESTHSSNFPVEVTPNHQPSEEPKHNWVVEEPRLQLKPCTTVSRGDLTRQNSRKSTAGPSKRLPHHHRRPHIHHLDHELLNNKSKNNLEKQNHITVNAPSRINSELLAIVPAEKCARVEPLGLLAQPPMTQTRVVGRIDRELMHLKCNDSKDTMRLKNRHNKVSSKPPSRLGSINERRTNSKPPSRLGSIKDRRTSSKPPSRLGSIKDRRSYNIAGRDQNHQIVEMHNKNKDRVEPKNYSIVPLKLRKSRYEIDRPMRKHPSRILRRMKSAAYSSPSSSSQTLMRSNTSTSSFSSPHRATRQAGPALHWMPSCGKNTGPPPRAKAKKQEEKNKEGMLNRFRNKLPVMFHHHHHHHHHLHDGQVARNRKQLHRSPWAYLKSVVHHTGGDGNGYNKVVKASERAPALRQHGYFHALIEGLIRHVWGMRREKRVGINSRVKGKNRFHWWQRFRRRGGVTLGNKKTLRLGFNTSQSKNFRNKMN